MPIPNKGTRYFQKFNLTDYDGQTAINLMKRVAFTDKAKQFITNFYEYTLSRDETASHVAFNYYDDPDYDWLIYHVNEIVDPQYDLPLNDFQFDNFIKKKYGSFREAQRRILYYQNNWRNDDRILSTSAYQALGGNFSGDGTDPDSIAIRKKYWEQITNAFSVIGYQRRKEDIRYSTNKIESINFASNSSQPLQVGEIITRDSDTRATVAWSNTSSCVIQHITGDFSANTDYNVTSDLTEQTISLDGTTLTLLRQVIPSSEEVYFSQVTAYDNELELNEKKRDIYLADTANKQDLNQQLENLLR